MAIDDNIVEIGVGAKLQLLNLPEVQEQLQQLSENDVTITANYNISPSDIKELLKFNKGKTKGTIGTGADNGLKTLVERIIRQQVSGLNKADEKLGKAITNKDYSEVFSLQGEIKGLLSSVTDMVKIYSKAYGVLDDFKIGDKLYSADSIASFGKEVQSRINDIDFKQVGQAFGKAIKDGGEALTPAIKEAVQNAIITVGKELKTLQSKMLKSDYDVSGAGEDYSRLVTLQTVLNTLMDDTGIKHIKKDKENDIPSISKSTIAGQTAKIEEKMSASGIDFSTIKESALKVVNSNEILGQILRENVTKAKDISATTNKSEAKSANENKTPKSIPKALKDSLRPQLNKIYDYENNIDSKITGEEFDEIIKQTKEIFTEMAKIDYDKAKSVFLGLAEDAYLLDEFKEPGHEDSPLPSKKPNEVFEEMMSRYSLPSKEEIEQSVQSIETNIETNINSEEIKEDIKKEITELNKQDIGTIYISNVRLDESATLSELRQDIEERLNAEPIKVTISAAENDTENSDNKTNIQPQVQVDISNVNISDEAVLAALKTRIEKALSPILISGIDLSDTDLETLKQKINEGLSGITIGHIEIEEPKSNTENTKSGNGSDGNKPSNKSSDKVSLIEEGSTELTEAGKMDSQIRTAKSDIDKINTKITQIVKNVEQLSELGETEDIDIARGTAKQYKKTVSDLRTKLKAIQAVPEQAERLTNVLGEIDNVNGNIDQMLTITETRITEIKNNKEAEKIAKAEQDSVAKQAEKENTAGLQTQAKLNRGIPGVEKQIDSLTKKFNDAVKVLGSDSATSLLDLSDSKQGIGDKIKLYKQQLEEIKGLVSGEFDLNNIDTANKKYEELTQQINKLIDRLKEESSLQKQQTSSTKSYANLISKMTGYQNTNSRLFRDKNLSQQFIEIMSAAQNTSRPVAELELRFKQLQTQVEATGHAGRSMTGQFKNLFEILGDRAVIGLLIEGLKQAAREMYNNVHEVDTAMTQVKKVTDETNATYDKFLTNAGAKAQKLGTTMTSVISSTADFAKLGYDLNEASALADSALIYSNVGDLDIQTATQDLVSATKAFDLSADETSRVVDSFNEVGNRFAVSAQQLGEGLQNSASTLVVSGNTMDQSIAMITGMTEITQDASSAGAALRTIALRLRGAKTELDAMGESTEDMAVSTAKLREQLKGMTGVDIMIDDKNFKSTYQIMKELSEVWDDLSDIDRSAVLELIAGKNRSNQAGALLSNFSQAEAALETSLNSAGSAAKENEAYLNSIEGKLAQLKATLQDLSVDFLNSESVKDFIELLNNLAKAADWVVEKFGGMPIILDILWKSLQRYDIQLPGFSQVEKGIDKVIDKTKKALGFLKENENNATSNIPENVSGIEQSINKTTTAVNGLGAAFGSLIKATAVMLAIDLIIKGISWSWEQFDKNVLEKTKYALENLENEKKALQDVQSELSDVNSQLEKNQKKIEEINANPLSITDEETLQRLQDENKELAAQKTVLEDIAELKKLHIENDTRKALNADDYIVTDKGLSADFKEQYDYLQQEYNANFDSVREHFNPFKNVIALIKSFVKAQQSDALTATDNTIKQYQNTLNELNNLKITSPEDAVKYNELQQRAREQSEALIAIGDQLSEQMDNVSTDSDIYNALKNRTDTIADLIERSTENKKSLVEEYVDNFINRDEETSKLYEEYLDKRKKRQADIDNKTIEEYVKTNIPEADIISYSDRTERGLYNFLNQKSIIKTAGNYDILDLENKTYQDIVDLQVELNEKAEEGELIESQSLKNLQRRLELITGISNEELQFVEDDRHLELVQLISDSLDTGELKDVTALTYKAAKEGLLEGLSEDDAAFVENILASLFPDYQTTEGLFKSYYDDTHNFAIKQAVDFSNTHSTSELQEYINNNEGLTEVFESLGISADQSAGYVQKLRQELQKENQQSISNTAKQNSYKFNTDKSDFDSNVKPTIDTYQSAIDNIRSGQSISYEDAFTLMQTDETLATKFVKTAEGYTIALDDLVASGDNFARGFENTLKLNISASRANIAETDKQIAELKERQASLDSTDWSAQKAIADEIAQLEQDKAKDNANIAKNKLVLDEITDSTYSYANSLDTVISKVNAWKTAYSNAMSDINSTGSLTPETVSSLISLDKDNWTSYIDRGENGQLKLNKDKFMESMGDTTGITAEMERAGEQTKEYEEQLKDIARQYGLTTDAGLDFKQNVERLKQILSSREGTESGIEQIDELTERYEDAAFAIEIMTAAMEAFFSSIEEYSALTDFNNNMEKLQHSLNMGEISQSQYDSAAENELAKIRSQATADGKIDDPDVASAIMSAEEQIHSAQQSEYQRQYEHDTEALQEQYDQRLIDYEAYLQGMAELDAKYYGSENSKGLLDDPYGTNAEDVKKQQIERAQQVYETEREKAFENYDNGTIGNLQELENKLIEIADVVRDFPELSSLFEGMDNTQGLTRNDYTQLAEKEYEYADKLLEKGDINNTQHAFLMRSIWEKYYKDKETFAQEDYESQKRYVDAAKDDIQAQINGIQTLIDINKERIEAQIDGIEKENDEIESYYDDEIAKIDEQIDAIEDKADAEDRFYNLKKAEQELEKASQRTRKVYASNGMVEYRYDPEAYGDAKKNYDDAKKDEEIAKLNDQKDELEKKKQEALEVNNKRIEDLNAQLTALNNPLEALIAAMSANLAITYGLDPAAIAAALSTDAADKALDQYNQNAEAKGEQTYTQEELATVGGAAVTEYQKRNVSQKTKDEQVGQTYTMIDTGEYEKRLGEKTSALVQMAIDAYKNGGFASNGLPVNLGSGYVPNATTITSSTFTIGDINITSPVGDSYDLAKELKLNLSNAFQTQTYSNLKR